MTISTSTSTTTTPYINPTTTSISTSYDITTVSIETTIITNSETTTSSISTKIDTAFYSTINSVITLQSKDSTSYKETSTKVDVPKVKTICAGNWILRLFLESKLFGIIDMNRIIKIEFQKSNISFVP